jgi:hypothetical protein
VKTYKIFWGDTHHNTYTTQRQDPSIAEILSFARTYLDFYSGAYYTPTAEDISLKRGPIDVALPQMEGHISEQSPVPADAWKGIRAERIKDPHTISRQWDEFQKATADHNSPGQFVTLPGYEWQGDGSWGDHNVIYKGEGLPVYSVMTLPELYDRLRAHDALAIPHHIGYHSGIRAPLWEYCDESISPFAEIYSIHGCSETDEEWIGLRHNSHMGPGVAGSTYQDALNSGLHLGAVCSTDNWSNMPGCWNQGLMACLATELTREDLWDAFRKRRVYGVTGDRIELGFTCNGEPVGSILEATPERNLQVIVRCQDAIDRIEILRNGRVIATYCHQGNWDLPSDGSTTRFKLRIEPGWGPRIGELPFLERKWSAEVSLSRGRFVGWSPCWVTRGQEVPKLDGAKARFILSSSQTSVAAKSQGALVLEFESDPSAEVVVQLNGKTVKDRVHSLAQGSRILWYRDECLDLIQKMTGIVPKDLERQDPLFYHYAFKAKLHRVIPEAGYSASFSITDTDELSDKTNYRVRVEQRNGQRAWSSPIWLEAE